MPFRPTPEEKTELLLTYATLILNDAKVPVTAEGITSLIKAAGGEVDSYWPKLFAEHLGGRDLNALLLSSVGSPSAGGGGGGAPAAGGAAPAAEKKAAEVKEEPKAEEEVDMGFSLFD